MVSRTNYRRCMAEGWDVSQHFSRELCELKNRYNQPFPYTFAVALWCCQGFCSGHMTEHYEYSFKHMQPLTLKAHILYIQI
ncbi:hypothetical protein F7725_028016 [Dissostichus mawsoni]|uniref:Uncharacterized protein n=1 Tax=Dissostichus mawsoni TaxID=36200 RepID=A0A7J5XGX5_DISMA|nr:hypothetical protein F7725_028016 [Dissostichus mawsoni]